MRVRKTLVHGGATLAHGAFLVHEAETVCASGCTEKADDGKSHALSRRPEEVASLLLPRSTVGYDVMAHVGIERFVRYRQREEIREDLESRFGVVLSSGEISSLAARFCVYLKALHLARAKPLRDALAADGGWPMHIDATGEDGKGTILCIYAGWRGWVLGSWKIPTEHSDAILPRMTEIARQFGAPCAVMRDLGRAVIEASQKFIASLTTPIPNLGCHMHFVRDVGKDLLRDSHDELRALFRRFKIVADLRSLSRDLGRKLGTNLDGARKEFLVWLEDQKTPYAVPGGKAGLAAIRALVQWTLDYADDGNDEGFPFDRPYHDLYVRCLIACRAAESFLSRSNLDGPALRALERLDGIVSVVQTEVPLGRHAAILAARARLLDELRDALRLNIKYKGRNATRNVLSSEDAASELQDIEAALRELNTSLHKRRPERGPARDMRKAIDLVIEHLARHGSSLFGHLVAMPESLGGGFRVVERTNVVLESFFHRIKHGERRRSGRKNLTQDLEHLPPEAALALNLTCPDYVQIVCDGSLEKLPAAFAGLDAGHRNLSLPARTRATASPAETATRSMTTIDRRLVRTDAMNDRVYAAATSRSTRIV